jgi:hypothetical protein
MKALIAAAALAVLGPAQGDALAPGPFARICAVQVAWILGRPAVVDVQQAAGNSLSIAACTGEQAQALARALDGTLNP